MNTTRKILYIGSIIVAMVLLASCEDFLVREPKLEQSNEISLSDFDGLQNATMGTYSLLCATNWYGRNFVIISDLKGGNAKRSPLTSGRFAEEFLWINDPTNTQNLWADAYRTISRANNVIAVIDGGFSEPGIEQADLDQLKGECLFMRALAHFDMLRDYAQPYTYATRSGASGSEPLGIPYIKVTELGYPARESVESNYNSIIADLLEAGSLLSETVVREGQKTPNTWATKYAAEALLAKVNLYKGAWQEAANHATAVINSGLFSLFDVADYTTWDKGGYWGGDGEGSEIIFQVDGSENNSAHGYWDAISYITDTAGYGDICASQDLIDLFEPGDVRADMFVSKSDYPTSFWPTKYTGRLGKVPAREYNLPVLRLAEMYLIRAEALLKGAAIGGVTALDDYNAIRTHRGLAVAASVDVQTIYEERRRELNFEGNELFDLGRTERGLVRNDFDGTVNKDIPFPDYRWAMAIPQTEIDANVNMQQNDGY
jgi:hypothetical protein